MCQTARSVAEDHCVAPGVFQSEPGGCRSAQLIELRHGLRQCGSSHLGWGLVESSGDEEHA